MRLDQVEAFVLDVDGTLVHRAGDEVHVQPGAVEVLARIRESGRQLAIFNNALSARQILELCKLANVSN